MQVHWKRDEQSGTPTVTSIKVCCNLGIFAHNCCIEPVFPEDGKPYAVLNRPDDPDFEDDEVLTPVKFCPFCGAEYRFLEDDGSAPRGGGTGKSEPAIQTPAEPSPWPVESAGFAGADEEFERRLKPFEAVIAAMVSALTNALAGATSAARIKASVKTTVEATVKALAGVIQRAMAEEMLETMTEQGGVEQLSDGRIRMTEAGHAAAARHRARQS